MRAAAVLLAALAWPAAAARAQPSAPASAPAPAPPGWFCVSSASKPEVDACFRDRAACEERRAALAPTLPDVTGCAAPTSAASSPAAAPAPPPDEGEDLLANPGPAPAPAKPGGGDTYGHQLKIFGVETTIGGYGDFTFSVVPEQREAQFNADHFNPIISARMTDKLSGELELDIEHGGEEIEVEYALVDWTPFESRALVVRAGKFLIPIGKFNEQYHPSFRYPQIGRPAMFTDVVPVEWSDVGLQLRGLVGRDVAVEYQAWAVNGLARPADEPDEPEGYVRDLRSVVEDNNFDKAFGARVGVNLGKKTDRVHGSVAISGQSGKIDPAGSERLSTADVDASLAVGPLVLNAEAAQTFLGRKGHYLDRFERGAYAQLAYTLGRLTPAVRWDYATEIAADAADPAAAAAISHQDVAASLSFAPAKQWSVRLELLVPYRPTGATDDTSVTAMLGFVF